jgi:hypothetical protein
MTVIRILFAVTLVITLLGGLLDDCQPCEDPSQLFCQRSASAELQRGG